MLCTDYLLIYMHRKNEKETETEMEMETYTQSSSEMWGMWHAKARQVGAQGEAERRLNGWLNVVDDD